MMLSLGSLSSFASGVETIFSKPGFYDGALWDPVKNELLFTAYGKSGNQIFRWNEKDGVQSWPIAKWTLAGIAFRKNGELIGADFRNHVILSFKFGKAGVESENVLVSDPKDSLEHFNQPNDLIESSSGWIYASDPDFKTKKHSAVWGVSPDGVRTKMISNLREPNGIAVSPDAQKIYVSDSNERKVYVFKINSKGKIDEGSKQVFFNPPGGTQDDADGMTVARDGTLYVSARGSIWQIKPNGVVTGRVVTPTFCSKVAVGGKQLNTLFASGKNAVYRISLPLPKPVDLPTQPSRKSRVE